MPEIIRRALATKNILEKMEISIRDNEIIVGNRTVKPRSGIISPEMDPYWIYKEKDTIDTRAQDPFIFKEEDKKIFCEELYPYWSNKSLKDSLNGIVSEEIEKAVSEKVFSLNQTDKGQGHIIPDFDLILNKGFKRLILEVENRLKQDKDNNFLKASLITLNASISHIKRYIKLIEEMILKEKMKIENKN